MNIFDFVTQEELDDLPEEPNQAFLQFVRFSQDRLATRTRAIKDPDAEGWEELNEARYGFVNVIIAAAKQYGIKPFSEMGVPTFSSFGTDQHRQFKADIDHYLTQLLLENSIRRREHSVLLDSKAKDRIRVHLHALREAVSKADMPNEKKEKLFTKLDDFDAHLSQGRTNILAVSLLALQVLTLPGGVWASVEISNRLVTNIMQIVAEAKEAEEGVRALIRASSSAQPALSPPRKQAGLTSSPAEIVDDEIPF